MPNVRHNQLCNIAARQYGYFSASQAGRAGYSASLQGYHVQNGNWQRIDHGIYRLQGYRDTLRSEHFRWLLWAQGLCSDRTVAISHQSALYEYGLMTDKPSEIHITVSSLRHQYENKKCILHWDMLAPADCNKKHGLRITSPARTLMDMKLELVRGSNWLDTAHRALDAGLINNEHAKILLGETLFQEMQTAKTSWAISSCGVNAPNPGVSDMEAISPRSIACGAHRMADMPGRQRSHWQTTARSFTLVEMLVVVAIMAILAALLMPAMNSALNATRQIACLNNMSKCYFSLSAYATDHNDWLPAPYAAVQELGGAFTPWGRAMFLMGYLPSAEIPYCSETNPNGGVKNIAEAMDFFTIGMVSWVSYNCFQPGILPGGDDPWRAAYRLTKIPSRSVYRSTSVYDEKVQPAKKALLVDATAYSSSQKKWADFFTASHGVNKIRMDGVIVSTPPAFDANGTAFIRHSEAYANQVFFDGHAGATAPDKLADNFQYARDLRYDVIKLF